MQPNGGAMFGRSVHETVELEKKFGGGGYVPFLMHRCCDYVKQNGTHIYVCWYCTVLCIGMCVCVCVYVCVCMYVCVCIYVHAYNIAQIQLDNSQAQVVFKRLLTIIHHKLCKYSRW